MRVLLIAPDHPNLHAIVKEVAAIVSYHEVEKVVGVVRDADIQQAVAKADFDIIWFATHGSEDGVLLSDSMLSPGAIGQYVGSSKAKLCVLNTCDSEYIANLIAAGGEVDMIYTISKNTGDEDALRFGSLLAKELTETDDFEAAFKIAAGPSPKNYRYLQAKQAVRGLAVQAATALERVQDKVEVLTNGQYKLTVDLAALVTRFDQMTQQALLSQQQALQAQSGGGNMASMDRRLMNNQPMNGSNGLRFPPTFWAILVLIALVVLAAVYLAARGG